MLTRLIFFIIVMGLSFTSFGKSTEHTLKVRSSYISFSAKNDLTIAGKLSYPVEKANGAAILILHGSNGIDSRGAFHALSLNQQGYTTLEIDLWAARGWVANKVGRPKSVHETLPDAFAALNFLSNLPEVDAEKVGVLGFSWGGVISMLVRNKSLSQKYSPDKAFAANVSFYPVCWVYSKISDYKISPSNLAPLLILTGDKDDYDLPTSCEELRSSLSPTEQRLVEVNVYPGAYHGFNGTEDKKVVTDPYSHLGKGGKVTMKQHPEARQLSNEAMLAFFNEQLF